MTVARDPFRRIRARAIAAVIALCALAFLGWIRPIQAALGHDLGNAAIEVAIYLSVCGVLAFLCARAGVDLRALIGPSLPARRASYAAALAVPLVALAVGSTWGVYLPLSYVTPELVETWVLDPVQIFAREGEPFPLLTNALLFLSMCVLAPVSEEFVFRGLLLHRFATRFGVRNGVLLSSALFGVLHVDVVGGVVFGIVTAILYLETRSLLAPILLHVTNNGIAYAMTVGETALFGPDRAFDLASFRASWWVGALGLAVGVPWTAHHLRAHWRPDAWSLPHASR